MVNSTIIVKCERKALLNKHINTPHVYHQLFSTFATFKMCLQMVKNLFLYD